MIPIVNVGDIFRCKRRGHLVRVLKVINDGLTGNPLAAIYANTRGAHILVPITRLLKPSRFEPISSQATIPVEQEAAAETVNA